MNIETKKLKLIKYIIYVIFLLLLSIMLSNDRNTMLDTLWLLLLIICLFLWYKKYRAKNSNISYSFFTKETIRRFKSIFFKVNDDTSTFDQRRSEHFLKRQNSAYTSTNTSLYIHFIILILLTIYLFII